MTRNPISVNQMPPFARTEAAQSTMGRTFIVCVYLSPDLVQRMIVLSADPVKIWVGEIDLTVQTVCE